ncbi:hypothetical protein L486_00236 [Kwoniella mangroviensis CBS 10435]|uniref:Uncharacterized protein n=1 Tax=Kwoniella mangroviensis CBS 10435 TaxID=1331196 RepID=A0A1B9IYJ8_9TREE|nr:hypothetical protein L486_00236 [Kwoniella mangroviensis CBS 10435]
MSPEPPPELIFKRYPTPILKKSSPLNPNPSPTSISDPSVEAFLITTLDSLRPPIISLDTFAPTMIQAFPIPNISIIPPSPPAVPPDPSSALPSNVPSPFMREWLDTQQSEYDYDDEIPSPPLPPQNQSGGESDSLVRHLQRGRPVDCPEDLLSDNFATERNHGISGSRRGESMGRTSSLDVYERIGIPSQRSNSAPPRMGNHFLKSGSVPRGHNHVSSISRDQSRATSPSTARSTPSISTGSSTPERRPISQEEVIEGILAEKEYLKSVLDESLAENRMLQRRWDKLNEHADYMSCSIDYHELSLSLLSLCACHPDPSPMGIFGPFDGPAEFKQAIFDLASTVGSPYPRMNSLKSDIVFKEIFSRALQVLLFDYNQQPHEPSSEDDLQWYTPPDVLWLFLHTAHEILLSHLREIIRILKDSCKNSISVRSIVLELMLDSISEDKLEKRRREEGTWRIWSVRQRVNFENNNRKLMDHESTCIDRKGKGKGRGKDENEGGGDIRDDLTRVSWEEIHRTVVVLKNEGEGDEDDQVF